MQLYVRIRGRVYGPFEENKLVDMVQKGNLSRAHQVSADGKSWTKASEYGELFDSARLVAEPGSNRKREPELGSASVAIGNSPTSSSVVPSIPAIPADWYYSDGSASLGPIRFQDLKRLCDNGFLTPDSLVWHADFSGWKPAGQIGGLFSHYGPNAAMRGMHASPFGFTAAINQPVMAQAPIASDKSRMVYVLLGLFLGCLGIHNFYAGYSSRGIAQLLITIFLGWAVVPWFAVAIWSLIDICTVTHDAQGRRFS